MSTRSVSLTNSSVSPFQTTEKRLLAETPGKMTAQIKLATPPLQKSPIPKTKFVGAKKTWMQAIFLSRWYAAISFMSWDEPGQQNKKAVR